MITIKARDFLVAKALNPSEIVGRANFDLSTREKLAAEHGELIHTVGNVEEQPFRGALFSVHLRFDCDLTPLTETAKHSTLA